MKASACCLVQRRGVSVRQHSSENPTTRCVRDALKCDPGKKEVWTPDVDLLSESRVYTRMRGAHTKKLGNRESLMVRTILEICLSETQASGNRAVWIKDFSHQAMLIPDAKAAVEKEWKEVLKRHTKQQQGKSTLLHWWTSVNSKVHVHSREVFERTILFSPVRNNFGLDEFEHKDLIVKWFSHGWKIRNREAHWAVAEASLHCQRPHEKHQQKRNSEIYVDYWPMNKMVSYSCKKEENSEEFRNITQCKYHQLNTPNSDFRMNFDNSWMVSYGSKLRKKEENFDKMCFESSKPIVEYHD